MKWKATCAFVALMVLIAAAPASFQQFALWYGQAASAGQALRSGILVPIIAPSLASVGMIFVVRRKRNQARRPDQGQESGKAW